VEPARALADLVEISPQLQAAAVVAGDGEIVGSVGVPEARAGVVAGAVRELLDGAAFRAESRVTQVHAELDDGDVFAVTGDDECTIVAVASGRPAPGLVFYDLKRCLSQIEREADVEA
jgi:predicted regulator of Ras-like GTPase activity (Roadblock/LC7/MglB family)